MVRTQIQLTEEQAHQLKILSVEKKTSVAGLIRQSIDRFIKTTKGINNQERIRRAINAVGKYKSGKSDVSRLHDKYLVEDYSK